MDSNNSSERTPEEILAELNGETTVPRDIEREIPADLYRVLTVISENSAKYYAAIVDDELHFYRQSIDRFAEASLKEIPYHEAPEQLRQEGNDMELEHFREAKARIATREKELKLALEKNPQSATRSGRHSRSSSDRTSRGSRDLG